MGYTRGYDTDVFISYAHEDDSEGWVREFHTRLQNRFRQLVARDKPQVEIWRDPSLDPTSLVDRKISARLKSAAVLLSVVTPNGMASRWCRDERNKFQIYATLNGGLNLGDRTRAVFIIKTPLPGDPRNHPFPSLSPDFHERDPQSGRFREYLPGEPKFEQGISDLAQSLVSLLDALNARPQARPKDAVFVALTPPDITPTRDKIVQELEAHDIVVLPPKGAVALDMPGFGAMIDDWLTDSKLAVHFSGERPGITPEGETLPLTALQFDVAARHKIPRIVWIEPNTKASEAFQKVLDPSDRQGTEILDNAAQTVTDLKRMIVKALGTATPPAPAASGARLNIYLLCDTVDFPSAATSSAPNLSKQIQDFLTQRGYAVWLPMIGAKNEQERKEDHEETLEMSDAVLVLWGATDEAWFRKRARELISIDVKRAYRPLLARASLLAAPPSNKEQYRNLLDMAIDLFGGFDPEKFAAFEQRLRPVEQ